MALELETDLVHSQECVQVTLMAEVAYRFPGATVCWSPVHRVTFCAPCDIDPAQGSAVFLNFQKQTIAGNLWVVPSSQSVFFQRANPGIHV